MVGVRMGNPNQMQPSAASLNFHSNTAQASLVACSGLELEEALEVAGPNTFEDADLISA